jgi:hypothetical protein
MVTGSNSVSIIFSMNQVVRVAFGDGLPVQPADDQQPVQRVDVIPRLLVVVTGSKQQTLPSHVHGRTTRFVLPVECSPMLDRFIIPSSSGCCKVQRPRSDSYS